MAGNSSRRGAVRKAGSKKGSTVGSGGQRRKALEGKGPTPKAVDRKNSPAQKAAKRAAANATTTTRGRVAAAPRSRGRDTSNIVVGRNPIVEALRANVQALKLHVATGIDHDDPALVLDDRHVLADLPQSPQRKDLEFAAHGRLTPPSARSRRISSRSSTVAETMGSLRAPPQRPDISSAAFTGIGLIVTDMAR